MAKMMKNREICDKVLSLNKRILLVAVFEGEELRTAVTKKGAKLFVPEKERPRLRLQLYFTKLLTKDWTRYFGNFMYSATRFRKAVLMIFPYGDKSLHVVAEPSLSVGSVSKPIQNILSTRTQLV